MELLSPANLSEDLKLRISKEFDKNSMEKVGVHGDIKDFFFVAQNAYQAQGVISGKSFYGSLQIKNLIVFEEARGHGIGKILLEKVFDFAREQGLLLITVETLSFQAQEFYLKHGFQLDYTRDGYQNDIKFHYMSRKL